MSIINSDIIFDGKLGKIMKNLVKEKIYKNNYEIFVEATLIGLYEGQRYEPASKESEIIPENRASISRTVFQHGEGSDISLILFTFLQHEKIYNEEAVPVQDVFMFSDDQQNKEILQELLKYTKYGILKIGEKWQEFLEDKNNSPKVEIISEMELLDTAALKDRIIEDNIRRKPNKNDEEFSKVLEMINTSLKSKGG